MRRRRDSDLRSTRRSRTYYPVGNQELTDRMRAAFSFEGLYTFLLYQDDDHVAPYMMGREGDGRARLVGPDAQRASDLVAFALSERGHPSVQEGVRDFFGTTAQYLVLGGTCTYEIDFMYRHGAVDGDPPEQFRLALITPGTLAELKRGSYPVCASDAEPTP